MDDDVEDQEQTASEIEDLLGDCREGLSRIRDIVKELSFFSRRSDALERRVELSHLVSSVFRLLSSQMCHVALRADVDDAPDLCADPGQLRQVLLNLMINAGHAISEGQRGEVLISTSRVGEQVEIRVRDNGVGIPREVQSKIFDPFFTTKPVGQGTGMGLAISRQLIERMKGALRVESEPGIGTTMIIKLPAWNDDQQPLVEEEEQTGSRLVATAISRALILVVDDEQALLNSIRRILSQRYEVVGHRRGAEALAWLEQGRRPDAILCDLMMPEMSGIEFYKEVSRRDPALAERFVFITGGTVTREAQGFVSSCHQPVVGKPFELDHIVETIESIVSGDDLRETA
jgi:two-component system, cell cycle sensor histidine kinase and response regulator CckA